MMPTTTKKATVEYIKGSLYKFNKDRSKGQRPVYVDIKEVCAVCQAEQTNSVRLYLKGGGHIGVFGGEDVVDAVVQLIIKHQHGEKDV